MHYSSIILKLQLHGIRLLPPALEALGENELASITKFMTPRTRRLILSCQVQVMVLVRGTDITRDYASGGKLSQ